MYIPWGRRRFRCAGRCTRPLCRWCPGRVRSSRSRSPRWWAWFSAGDWWRHLVEGPFGTDGRRRLSAVGQPHPVAVLRSFFYCWTSSCGVGEVVGQLGREVRELKCIFNFVRRISLDSDFSTLWMFFFFLLFNPILIVFLLICDPYSTILFILFTLLSKYGTPNRENIQFDRRKKKKFPKWPIK